MLASYARFLWDADDDEEVEEEETVSKHCAMKTNMSSTEFIHRESHWPPLAAAS